MNITASQRAYARYLYRMSCGGKSQQVDNAILSFTEHLLSKKGILKIPINHLGLPSLCALQRGNKEGGMEVHNGVGVCERGSIKKKEMSLLKPARPVRHSSSIDRSIKYRTPESSSHQEASS